jgi:hypothetical protein
MSVPSEHVPIEMSLSPASMFTFNSRSLVFGISLVSRVPLKYMKPVEAAANTIRAVRSRGYVGRRLFMMFVAECTEFIPRRFQ